MKIKQWCYCYRNANWTPAKKSSPQPTFEIWADKNNVF